MAKYNVVSNVDSSSAEQRKDGVLVAARLSAANNYGPAAEEAICPSRLPDAHLAASLTCDPEYQEAEAMDAALAANVADLKGLLRLIKRI